MSRFSSDEKTCAKCKHRALFFTMAPTNIDALGEPPGVGAIVAWICRDHDACASRAAARQP